MTKARMRSMRARITALFALFVALLMAAGGAAVQHRETRRAEKRTREILSIALEQARAEIEEDTQTNSRESLLQLAATKRKEIAAGRLVLLVAENGKVLWRSQAHAPAWPRIGPAWRAQTLSRGPQTLIIARDWAPVEEDLHETARALWALGVLVVGATTWAAWFVVGVTLSPLDRLAAQAQNASIEELAVRLQSPSSDAEMKHLTRTLNDLLARLEKETQARGRFYAAASHELRTPIQVLLGEIDVARSRPRQVAEHEVILAQLGSETERLAVLVADLLQLNALEMRQNPAPAESLNLAFWTQRALEQQQRALGARDLRIETRLPDTDIEAPSAHLEILLRNLLENAIKYATPGSTVRVECAPGELTLWNACELPADAKLENWFEPFYRPDAARNSQTGGNGLGLSIVAALARANGWKVQLQAQEGGVLATVEF